MNVGLALFIIAVSGVVALCSINLYLLSVIRKLERENESLQPPF
jgi:hypothetical protein